MSIKQKIISEIKQFMQSELLDFEQLTGDKIPEHDRQYYANIFDRGDRIVITGTLMINYNRSWEHPELDKIVAPYGMQWEWETPEAIVLCKN